MCTMLQNFAIPACCLVQLNEPWRQIWNVFFSTSHEMKRKFPLCGIPGGLLLWKTEWEATSKVWMPCRHLRRVSHNVPQICQKHFQFWNAAYLENPQPCQHLRKTIIWKKNPNCEKDMTNRAKSRNLSAVTCSTGNNSENFSFVLFCHARFQFVICVHPIFMRAFFSCLNCHYCKCSAPCFGLWYRGLKSPVLQQHFLWWEMGQTGTAHLYMCQWIVSNCPWGPIHTTDCVSLCLIVPEKRQHFMNPSHATSGLDLSEVQFNSVQIQDMVQRVTSFFSTEKDNTKTPHGSGGNFFFSTEKDNTKTPWLLTGQPEASSFCHAKEKNASPHCCSHPQNQWSSYLPILWFLWFTHITSGVSTRGGTLPPAQKMFQNHFSPKRVFFDWSFKVDIVQAWPPHHVVHIVGV